MGLYPVWASLICLAAMAACSGLALWMVSWVRPKAIKPARCVNPTSRLLPKECTCTARSDTNTAADLRP